MRSKVEINYISPKSTILAKSNIRGLVMPLILAVSLFTSFINAGLIPMPKSVPADTAPTTSSSSFEKLEKIETPASSVSTIKTSYAQNKKTPVRTTRTTNKAASSISTASSSTTQPSQPSSYFTINGRSSAIFNVASNINAFPDAGRSIGFYRGKFFYGHRHSSVFGQLASASVGNTVSITLNGATSAYRISNKITLEWNDANSNRGNFYNAIDNNGVQHKYALQTCAGSTVTLPNGTTRSSHITYVFLD